jgi:hypothetical protein
MSGVRLVVVSNGQPTKPVSERVVVRKGRRCGPPKGSASASREAQRLAAVVLEVLAGVRTPTEAASAVSVPLPRYYLWEQRALEGLVRACEPRPVGKRSSERHRIASLEKEVARLRQDCARQQALVRASQRTIGLTAPSPPASKPGRTADKAGQHPAGKARHRRRPVARALRAAAALRADPVAEETPTVSSSVTSTEVLQRSVANSLSQPSAGASTQAAASET